MELKFDKKLIRNVFLSILGIIVVYWVLHEPERAKNLYNGALGVLTPFIVGGVLAFILNVPMRAFERLLKGIKHNFIRRLLAVVLTMLCLALILALVFILLIPELKESILALGPKIADTFNRLWVWINQMLEKYPEIKVWFNENIDLKTFDFASLVQRAMSAIGNGISFLVPQAFTAIGSVISFILSGFISVAFAFYTLFQKETLARQGRKVLYAIIPEKTADYIIRVLRLTNVSFSNFLSGQCLEVLILGAMFAIAMAIFRMPYIALISVLVAICAFVPVVGAWIGCIVGAFLIFVSNPIQAVWFIVMFLVLQAIENNFIYPRVAGNSVGLNGMWVLIAVGVGGELMGVAGMFLMIPITSVVYVLIKEAIHNRLEKRNIPEEKLQAQPPEVICANKEKREKKPKKSK